MRVFLKYLYTGKLQFDLSQVMGILRIASFFNMEDLIESCKGKLTDPHYLSAYDLCALYREVRERSQDFDDMKLFLTKLIPKRLENHMICSVLKEIWTDNDLISKSKAQEVDVSYKYEAGYESDLQDILI